MLATTRMWILVAVPIALIFLVKVFWDYGHTYSRARRLSPARAALLNYPVRVERTYRKYPIRLQGLPGAESCVSDAALRVVLDSALPRWTPPPVPNLIHELKLWGADAKFDPKHKLGNLVVGRELVEVLLSDELCKLRTVPVGNDYLVKSPYGLRVVEIGSPEAVEVRGEGHIGQLLKALAEAGVNRDTPVHALDAHGTITDLLNDLTMRFSVSSELEFATVAFALWLAPQKSWTNRHGQLVGFDELIEKLVDQPMGAGACLGCHVPYAIAVVLRVDDVEKILSPTTRQSAEERLVEFKQRLELTQRSDGAWDASWSGNLNRRDLYPDDLIDAITATGHHLEWIALVPSQLRISNDRIECSVDALSLLVQNLMQRQPMSFKDSLPCIHAARALCLLRRVDAFTIWSRYGAESL
jgi:hypothetical protein